MSSYVMSRLSIRYRILLATFAVLLTVITVYAIAAYQEVKRSAMLAASERLQSVTRQIGDLLAASARQRVDETQTLAAAGAVRSHLQHPTARSRTAALDALQRFVTQPGATAAVDLLDRTGRRVLTTRETLPPMEGSAIRELLDSALGAKHAAVGALRVAGDSLSFPVIAGVTEGKELLGFVVQHRRVASSAAARQQLTDLIGSGAGLFVGNARGDVWTDLVRVTDRPPVDFRSTKGVVQYRRPGGDGQLAAATAVGGTPWILLLEFPRSVVFDRARAILRWFALLAVVVLGLGSVAAWGLSRGLTQPLVELAAAAEAISRGDHARRVSAARDDELGTLARAFNGMAQSVEDGRRQLQEQLAQLEQRIAVRTEELVVSNRELEAFSYSVSHDLRAPLRSIDGFSQALLEDCADQLDEHGKDHLRRVRAATQHLADLIEDLLGLARVTRAELRREPVDLTAMAHRVVAELREREPGRPVDFRCGDGLAVDADPRLLRVLLTNLLGNAWKFTSRQPRPRIEFGWTPDGDRPAYFVRDNGAGFDMAYVTKLFGVFQRLHSAAEFPGTGVGLATVQRIVHRHGGRVWAEAAVGQGASFYFSLEPR